ncbi:MAG: hypothetical protein ACC682_14855 [Gemmatimonadota bacterium]
MTRRADASAAPPIAFLAFLWVIGVTGCQSVGNDVPEPATREAALETIETVLKRVTDRWMANPGVVGTGIGLCDDRPCIKVFASRPADQLDPPIPEEVDGYPVRVEVTGPIRALDTIPDGD